MNVKIGVIGFGWMAYYHYEHIVPKDEGVEIVAAYDSNPERVAFVKEIGLSAYSDFSAFLKDDNFDTVLVATPNDKHKEMAIAAMRAGKNVICEKPATLNVNELEEIIQVSKECGKIFTVHQNRRRDRDFLSVKQAIADGTLGNPFFIETRVQGSNGIPGDWRRSVESGGGMLYDWGVHLIDQLLQMIDSPVTEIYAQMFCVKYDVDDNVKVLFKFKNGVCAQMDILTDCFQSLPRWHVLGSDGTLNIMNFKGEGSIIRGTVKEVDWSLESVHNYAGSTRTMRPRPNNTIETLDVPQKETDWSEFYRNYRDVLMGKAELLVKPEESLRVARVVEKVFESSKKGAGIQCCI